jgi:hypothetical protein
VGHSSARQEKRTQNSVSSTQERKGRKRVPSRRTKLTLHCRLNVSVTEPDVDLLAARVRRRASPAGKVRGGKSDGLIRTKELESEQVFRTLFCDIHSLRSRSTPHRLPHRQRCRNLGEKRVRKDQQWVRKRADYTFAISQVILDPPLLSMTGAASARRGRERRAARVEANIAKRIELGERGEGRDVVERNNPSSFFASSYTERVSPHGLRHQGGRDSHRRALR